MDEKTNSQQQNNQNQQAQGQNQQAQGQNQQAQGQNQQAQGQNQQAAQQQATQTWEDVQKTFPEETKKLYEAHIQGLQNSVKATRDERDTLKMQVTDALKKAEKGSELEKTLTDTLGKLDAAEKRANFAEQAIKPEIGCRNVKAAFALASAEGFFRKNGDPDWDAIKKELPEVFGPLIPDGNGGNGTGNQPAPVDMNALIRKAAGH